MTHETNLQATNLWFLALAIPALLMGCQVDDNSSTRTPIGKVDSVGSCAGDNDNFCGEQSEGNCWCDDLCEAEGDCCADRIDVCLQNTDQETTETIVRCEQDDGDLWIEVGIVLNDGPGLKLLLVEHNDDDGSTSLIVSPQVFKSTDGKEYVDDFDTVKLTIDDNSRGSFSMIADGPGSTRQTDMSCFEGGTISFDRTVQDSDSCENLSCGDECEPAGSGNAPDVIHLCDQSGQCTSQFPACS